MKDPVFMIYPGEGLVLVLFFLLMAALSCLLYQVARLIRLLFKWHRVRK